jgi:RNA polymerase sigma factor (sigma-70 family)
LPSGVPRTRSSQAATTDSATAVTAADAWLTYLYDSYQSLVYKYCLGRLRSKEDADDAVQNTFLRAYTALRRGVRPENEGAWLFKIAHNVCLSRQAVKARRSGHESLRSLEDLEFIPAREHAEPEELSGLSCAIASLPAPLRQVILLREWQGLSYAEIAEALEISHAAVEARIFRARRFLARALRPASEAAAA